MPIVTLCEDLPDLTEAEVAHLTGRAEEIEGVRVRRIVHNRAHPGEHRYVALLFEHHRTRARIRRSGSIVAGANEREDDDGREAWIWETERVPVEYAEVCAPGRSFLDHSPVPEPDVVRFEVTTDLTDEEIVQIVDAAYDHVPAGEKLAFIRREGDGAVEVMTELARKYETHSGSTLEMRRGPRGWAVTVIGEWQS